MKRENANLWKVAYDVIEIIVNHHWAKFEPYEVSILTYKFVRDIENCNTREIRRRIRILSDIAEASRKANDIDTLAKVMTATIEMGKIIDELLLKKTI